MLKNKKAIYILVPLNVLIWGFFTYRFFMAYNQSDLPQLPEKTMALDLSVEKDSIRYKLNLNYKDPFLRNSGRSYAVQNKNVDNPKRTPSTPAIAKAPAPVKNLPDIKYMGLIKNTSSGMSTALISVNGQSRLVKQNETIEGIFFKSLTRDSLVANCGKDRIVVRK